jgi:hypothetical protein
MTTKTKKYIYQIKMKCHQICHYIVEHEELDDEMLAKAYRITIKRKNKGKTLIQNASCELILKVMLSIF